MNTIFKYLIFSKVLKKKNNVKIIYVILHCEVYYKKPDEYLGILDTYSFILALIRWFM